MACLALANDLQDLKDRMGNMVIGSSKDKVPITADDLGFLKILILLFFYIYIYFTGVTGALSVLVGLFNFIIYLF
jgi:hypothetical protein